MSTSSEKIGNTKPLYNPWKGYRKARTWGKWLVIYWPDVHPQSHCDEDQYTPDKNQACSSCLWIPPSENGKREDFELIILMNEVSRNINFNSILFTAWQAYIDTHREQLIGPPTFGTVREWWNKLPTAMLDEYLGKYTRMIPDKSDVDPVVYKLLKKVNW